MSRSQLSESAKGWLVSWVLDRIWGLLVIAFTTAAPAISGILFDPGIPWIYIITCTAVTFAAVTVGLVTFRQWSVMETPRHKLRGEGYNFDWSGVLGDDGKFVSLSGAYLTYRFKNLAFFPLSVIVEEFDCTLEGRVPKEKNGRGIPILLDAQGDGFFRDDTIDLSGLPLKNLQGTLTYKIRYGKEGREKFHLQERLKISVLYDAASSKYFLHQTTESRISTIGHK